MGDEASAATVLLSGLRANDLHNLAIELEFDLGLRQQARPLADFSWNGHLTFGCDAHDDLQGRAATDDDGHCVYAIALP